MNDPLRAGILLFDGVAALDAVGPFEVLCRVPGIAVELVGKSPGTVRGSGRLGLTVDHALASVATLDVLVPGGRGIEQVVRDAETLRWIRHIHAGTRITASVCTGSLVLAAAGLLDGVEATTHWARMEELASLGARPVHDRVVRAGKLWTGAGVSAGIDLALALVAELRGEAAARTVQLAIEYDPAPPFESGHPDRAPAEAVDAVRKALSRAVPLAPAALDD